jgi:GNAT superfamily N-acetyltransferase
MTGGHYSHNACMDLLAQFDEQVRRAVTNEDGLWIDDGWNAVLALPPDVERTVERLRGLPGYREWKLYGHDPDWLPARLRELGLVPEDEEAVMVIEASALPAPPADVDLRDDPEAFAALAAEVFGARHELPANAAAVVAFADGKPVSSGRIDLDPGTEFAGLFGGVTLPEFRGRGLYRATVLRRAEIARERGYRWLFVDALPTSRPILEWIGFTQLTTTTPYVFVNPGPAASSSG